MLDPDKRQKCKWKPPMTYIRVTLERAASSWRYLTITEGLAFRKHFNVQPEGLGIHRVYNTKKDGMVSRR